MSNEIDPYSERAEMEAHNARLDSHIDQIHQDHADDISFAERTNVVPSLVLGLLGGAVIYHAFSKFGLEFNKQEIGELASAAIALRGSYKLASDGIYFVSEAGKATGEKIQLLEGEKNTKKQLLKASTKRSTSGIIG